MNNLTSKKTGKDKPVFPVPHHNLMIELTKIHETQNLTPGLSRKVSRD